LRRDEARRDVAEDVAVFLEGNLGLDCQPVLLAQVVQPRRVHLEERHHGNRRLKIETDVVAETNEHSGAGGGGTIRAARWKSRVYQQAARPSGSGAAHVYH
jgi:hypothetical protein